jgi:signal transduction histidine kinase
MPRGQLRELRDAQVTSPRTAPGRSPALLQSEEALSVVFNRSPSFMALTVGRDHVFALANPKYFEVFHLDQTILGQTVAQVFPEIVVQGFIDRLDKAFDTGEPFRADEAKLVLAIPGGGERLMYVDFVYQPVRDAQGLVYGIVHQGSDSTDRVHSRRAIENERENFRNLFRQTPEMVCILRGPEHIFEFVNEAHIRALGFDATGMPVRKGQPDSVEVHGILDGVYQTGKTAELHEIEVSVSNRRRYFNLTYAARRNEQGVIDGIMVLGIEVTGQVLVRESLKSSQSSLEAAVQARDDFLSIASHELKTPITSMMLQQQFFRRKLLQSEQDTVERAPVDKLLQQSERQMGKLTRLVEDMLDIARIRSGKLTVTREKTSLSALVREVADRFEPILRQNGTPLELDVREELTGMFDAFRIEQMITNLLTNAMRYGEKRPVRMTLERRGQRALLSVADHGRGIEKSAHDRIFDRFERSISPSEVSGLGLGLFITREIVQAHQGRVWVESEGPGKGSTFFVELDAE